MTTPAKCKPTDGLAALRATVAGATPARAFVGRTGPAYRTATQLELRSDHAAARDAVAAEFDLARDFAADFVQAWSLFAVESMAANKTEYLLRPDRGRALSLSGRSLVVDRCPAAATIQMVIGDGLSAVAVARQTPALLPLLAERVRARGWTWGQPFVVRHCRVGILNEIGDALRPQVAVLLIGERPGLATAESLSAYMAYRPKSGDTDAHRNLISNIHARGVPVDAAADRIVALAALMLTQQTSGVTVKEEWAPALA